MKNTEETKKAATQKLNWKDDNMKSLYSNITSITGGKEEIIALFGMTELWKENQEEINVDIIERVVMSPYTAKRLAIMLNNTLVAYENKFGTIINQSQPLLSSVSQNG